jgi:hypothetical protein
LSSRRYISSQIRCYVKSFIIYKFGLSILVLVRGSFLHHFFLYSCLMDSTSRNAQGYSDFFTSGLRAMTGRDRRRTKAKSADLSQSANRLSFWTDEYFELEQSTNRFSGRRRASVIIGGTVKDDGARTSPTKKRRSGLSSFSARWFSRAKDPGSSPSIPPATHDEDDHALYADDEKEQSSLSIERPSLPSLHERRQALNNTYSERNY